MPNPADLTTAGDPTLNRGRAEADNSLPALTIIAHPHMRRAGQYAFLMRRGPTLLSRVETDFRAPGATFGRPMEDPFVSRKAVSLTPRPGGLEIDNRAVGRRLVVDGKPCTETVALTRADLARGVTLELADRVCLLLHLRRFPPDATRPADGMIGHGDAVHQLRAQLAKVADLDTPVLLLGASGTGKELAAEYLAAVRKGPFVRVNMAAIPPSLAAAELFGTAQGAFTGADRDRPGFFAAADGGTLFLDEIGDLPLEAQPLLLRALESGDLQAVGARTCRKVKVRVVAATDAALEAQVAEGRFKAPLWHRLAGYVVRLPTLAQRREDLGVLLVHFADALLRDMHAPPLPDPDDPYAKPWLPAHLAAALTRYTWPGNVRQLRNVLHQLLIHNRGAATLEADPATLALLHTDPPAPPAASAPAAASTTAAATALSDGAVLAALKDHDHNIKAAATALGLSRSAFYRRLAHVPGFRKAADLTDAEIEAARRVCDNDPTAMAAHLEVSAAALQRRIHDADARP